MPFQPGLDPFTNLDVMVKEATDLGLKDANAMALATIRLDPGQEPKPSVRNVLYKGLIRGGLSFYTNYEGRKARDLQTVANVSVCFFWATLEQQIRIEGKVEKLTRAESESYFNSRPRISQIGAWASAQSVEISGPDYLKQQVAHFEKEFLGKEIPCPPHWGGYHILPSSFEFWFGRHGRLHDRFCYERQGNTWRQFMRSP